jgi:hypothetical protein
MKTAFKKQNTGKWFPLIALPILLLVCFLLWLSLTPDAAPIGQDSGLLPAFPPLMVMGTYLALFFAHLILYLILEDYKANILFSLASFVWFLRIGVQLIDVFPLLTPSQDALIGSRLMYLAVPVMVVLMHSVINKLFPDLTHKWFQYALLAMMAFFVLVFLVLGSGLLNYVFLFCVGVLCVGAVYLIICFILKLRTILPEQLAFLIGAAIFIHGALYSLFWSGGSLPLAVRYLTHNYMLVFSLFVSASLIIATVRGILESNAARQRQAAQDIITENQLDFQREQFGRLMENMESARYMRHDMKHHLAVISDYVNNDDVNGIKGYLEGLELGMSSSRNRKYCDNHAVNAIINHYLGFAETDGVRLKIKLTVPAEAGRVRDTDLCVVVGNFLENAVEACRHVPKEERFIRLFSYVQDNTLTFTMENSFDGELKEFGGVFYSTKRDGEGVGLSSVAAVSRRYDGASRFESQGNMFLSSAYMNMGYY